MTDGGGGEDGGGGSGVEGRSLFLSLPDTHLQKHGQPTTCEGDEGNKNKDLHKYPQSCTWNAEENSLFSTRIEESDAKARTLGKGKGL